jgi:broad specificity phosphatase PhoE
MDQLLEAHTGQAILAVAHHAVLRTYLAVLIGLTPDQARRVSLQNGDISVVVREEGSTRVERIDDCAHLAGLTED